MNESKRPRGQRLARILVQTAVIVAIPVGLLDWIHRHACPTEVYDNVPVANSDWVIEKQFRGCALAVDLDFVIQARNTRTQEVVIIAENDDGPDSTVVSDGPDHVTIRLDNRTPLRPIHDTFGPVHVSYDYLPKDDPADRAAYQRWYYDEGSSENIKWYCTHVMAGMDQANYDSYNRILAHWAGDGRSLYCK